MEKNSNIHYARDCYFRLYELSVGQSYLFQENWYSKLEGTNWLKHIQKVLSGACTVASLLRKKYSVLVHCRYNFLC